MIEFNAVGYSTRVAMDTLIHLLLLPGAAQSNLGPTSRIKNFYDVKQGCMGMDVYWMQYDMNMSCIRKISNIIYVFIYAYYNIL